MSLEIEINSNQYWNGRFDSNWEECHGREQSRFFAHIAIKILPVWLMEKIKRESLTLVDWGCALGDGTDVWATHVRPGNLFGVDFSEVAIKKAASKYPEINFQCSDWLNENERDLITYDLIFSSNTLEHFANPHGVLESIAGRSKKAIILTLPFREMERIAEHSYSFTPENIPSILRNGYRLCWARIIDCKELNNTHWNGEQIVLVYADPRWTDTLNLTLNECQIEISGSFQKVDYLNKLLKEFDAELKILKTDVAQRDEHISSLKKAIAERDNQIVNFEKLTEEHRQKIDRLTDRAQNGDDLALKLSKLVEKNEYEIQKLTNLIIEKDSTIQDYLRYREDKEIYIAMLKDELSFYQKSVFGIAIDFFCKGKKIKIYSQRALAIIKNRGLVVFLRSLRKKIVSINASRNLNSTTKTDLSPQFEETSRDDIPQLKSAVDEKVLDGELVIIASVPFDDIGGGQRSAQLARCALKTGQRVIYIYLFQKYDFERRQHVKSYVEIYNLRHFHIDEISPKDLLQCISSEATLLIEIPHKKALPFLRKFNLRGMRTVFELIDDWNTSLGGDWFKMEDFKKFICESKVVVGTAKALIQQLNELGRLDAVYLPNAGNEYIFDKYKNFTRPKDLPIDYARIAIYFGSLYGEWFAWDHIQEAATMNPTIAFVLIGDRPAEEKLPKYIKNVYFLGAKMLDSLPEYLAYADFALLPFIPGKLCDAVSPIKIFEYLFSGTKVVATDLPEINGYHGVNIAKSASDFARICSEISISDLDHQENDRFISENSWFSRLDTIEARSFNSKYQGMVSAVILIHNNKKIIGRCLESLLRHCKSYLKEIIVVDNLSSDGGPDYVERYFPSVKLLRNTENGCSSGRNLGASIATGLYLAFFDSDQWFTSSFGFEEALSILNKNPYLGAIGWGAGWFDSTRADFSGPISDYLPNRAMNDAALVKGYRCDIGYLGTCGIFMPRTVFEATEGFDTAYDPTCFEDTDLSFQIKRLGFDIGYRDLSGIRHQPHQTTKADPRSEKYIQLFKKNAAIFGKKWSTYTDLFVDYSF